MDQRTLPLYERKPGRYLGLGYILAAALFLFDPFFSVFDFLPDCIGYLLLSRGLYRLGDLDDRLSEAARGARRMALLGLGRLLALVLVFGFVSPSEQPVFILLALFTLAVLDVIVLVPLWKQLCGGLLYLGSRQEATFLLHTSRSNGTSRTRTVTERYAIFSAVYFLLKDVLAVLPELTVLTHEKGGMDGAHATRLYDYIALLREFFGLVALILGIVWLVRTIVFIRRLAADTPFLARLVALYRSEVLSRHDLFAMRAVKASLISLCAAALLGLDIYLEGINVLPDPLVAVMLCLSMFFLRCYIGRRALIPPMLVTVAYGISAAVTWGLQFSYFSIHDLEHVADQPALYARWETMAACQVITSGLLVASYILVLRAILGLVRRYTGVQAFHEHSTYAEDRTRDIHRVLQRKMVLVGVLVALTAASTWMQWLAIPFLPDMILRGEHSPAMTILLSFYQLIQDGYWLIDVALGGVLIGVSIHVSGEISDQMEYRYMMT